jgi:hypothetical protein
VNIQTPTTGQSTTPVSCGTCSSSCTGGTCPVSNKGVQEICSDGGCNTPS